MLKSCPIYFCCNRRKLLKPHCSLAAKRGNLVNTGFLFSRDIIKCPEFPQWHMERRRKPDWGIPEVLCSLWATILTGYCKHFTVAWRQLFVPSDSTGREGESPGPGQFWIVRDLLCVRELGRTWAMKTSLECFFGVQEEKHLTSFTVPEVITNRWYAANSLKHYNIVMSHAGPVLDI